jgi:hypothetical protein
MQPNVPVISGDGRKRGLKPNLIGGHHSAPLPTDSARSSLIVKSDEASDSHAGVGPKFNPSAAPALFAAAALLAGVRLASSSHNQRGISAICIVAPTIDMPAGVNGWRRHDVTAIASHIEAAARAAGYPDAGCRRPEIEMPPARGFHDRGLGQKPVPSDKGLQGCETIGAINIDDDESRYGARCDADVGVGPFAPPCLDLASIGGCELEAAFDARMFGGGQGG